MTGFNYFDDTLHADKVALEDLAAEYGTPLYVYSQSAIVQNFHALKTILAAALGDKAPLIAFAVKANSNLAVIRALAEQGAGADLVSGGELTRAFAAGVSPDKIVFSGVGKTRAELRAALQHRIHQINIESEFELEHLIALTDEMQQDVSIVVRINPNVDAKTHAKITTGKAKNKFGVHLEKAPALFARALQSRHVKAVGVAIHIGSQLTDIQPFRDAFKVTADFVRELRLEGYTISRIDLGGGLGIVYNTETPPDLNGYAEAIAAYFGDMDAELVLAPGRFLVGNAGVLLTRIIGVKHGESRKYIVTDAAMNDLARPSLYDAHHNIVAVTKDETLTYEKYDIVGPVCETGDTFAIQRILPQCQEGELLALMDAGAYGAVMASMYNSRDLVAEVMVHGDHHRLIRRRWTLDEQLKLEQL